MVAEALARTIVTRSGKRSCDPDGSSALLPSRRVTKRVAYKGGDSEGEAIGSPDATATRPAWGYQACSTAGRMFALRWKTFSGS